MREPFLMTASPVPSFGALISGRGPFSVELDSFDWLYAQGRSAIYWACRGLKLPPESLIWMPALHCGVEVQAALDAGLTVGFYRLDDHLMIDEHDLESKLRDCPGVVFVIHFFGFGQLRIERIAELCQRTGSILMEDCAHALFSEHAGLKLGDFAPLAIFSLRKTLAIPDGGALKVNPELLRRVTQRAFEPPPSREFSTQMLFHYLKSATRGSVGPGAAGVYRNLRSRTADEPRQPVAPDANLRSKRHYNFAMSILSRRVAGSVEPTQIVETRRHNYLMLDQALMGSSGYRKVFEHLPTGVCPLFLPVWVAEREILRSTLRSHGIETFRFGSAPHPLLDADLCEEVAEIRNNILCLPVHQQITDKDIEKVSMILRPLLASHEFSARGRSSDNRKRVRAASAWIH